MKLLNDIRALYLDGKLAKQAYIDNMHAKHRLLFEYSEFLKAGDVKSIEITEQEVIFTSRRHGVRLVADPHDQHLVPYTLLNFEAYDETELALLLKIMVPDALIFDVGANCGWYSLVLGRSLPNAQIHAFEPIPHTCQILSRNLELNGLDHVTVHPIGLSDIGGAREFLYTPQCSGATSLQLTGQPGEVFTVPVVTKTLDEFCGHENLIPDFIKCDVEGAELLVLRGGERTLSEYKPILLLELLRKWAAKFHYHPNEVLDLLSRYGYRCYTFNANNLFFCDGITETTAETNFLFLHLTKHSAILSQFVMPPDNSNS